MYVHVRDIIGWRRALALGALVLLPLSMAVRA